MTISIDMLDKSGIVYDWRTLYVGVSVDLIDCNELTIYALKMMYNDEYDDDEFINELTWGIEDYLKDEILTKMILKFNFDILILGSKSWELETRKLRYVVLNYLRSTIEDNNELLGKVEEVYADFNYPQDMEAFIAYMPVKEKLSMHSIDDNKKHIINNLDNFLITEKKYLNDKLTFNFI